jgi:choline dehydrogenase
MQTASPPLSNGAFLGNPNCDCDYVIVGGGSAGCVLASRLSESGRYKVVLVEAGERDRNPWIHIPLGYGKLFDHPRLNWRYESEPESALDDRTVYQPRGKVLGGTGSINGMVYARGPREDFDRWRQLGCKGWGYEDVLPYFARAERIQDAANEYPAAGGPLAISRQGRHELGEAFVEAARQAGHPVNPDFNGPTAEGVGHYHSTVFRGRRWSTSVAYLRPALKRHNLSVLTNALATRILFSGRDAIGVEYRQSGQTRRVAARREVILAAGVFNSPQLLELSGIGASDRLSGLGLPVIHELAGVGENLQDHFMVGMVMRCTKPVTLNDIMKSPWRRAAMFLRYMLFRKGALAESAMYAGAFLRTDSRLSTPDLQLNLAVWSVDDSGRSRARLHRFPGFNIGIVHLRPESRGSVHIKSADPSVPPAIRFNYFQSEGDERTMVRALRMVREITRQPAIAPYVAEESVPGHAVNSDADIIDFCRQRGRSCLHPASSCKMGMDPGSVVDDRLRVHGLCHLRAVDGSIMPLLVGANPNAATIMIAEKGAEMILEDNAA